MEIFPFFSLILSLSRLPSSLSQSQSELRRLFRLSFTFKMHVCTSTAHDKQLRQRQHMWNAKLIFIVQSAVSERTKADNNNNVAYSLS